MFSPDYPLDLFLICPVIVRRIEEVLRESGSAELRSHLNNLRFYVAMLWTLRCSRVPRPSIQAVAAIDAAGINSGSIISCATDVMLEYKALGATDQVAKGTQLAKRLIENHQKACVAELTAAKEGRIG